MIRIITDSTCDLPIQELEQKGVIVLSLTVQFGQEQYKDKRELSNEDFYAKLKVSEELPKTSLLNPQDFLECFEQYPEDDLVVVTLSSQLSGTYQSATIAKQMMERENIYLVDSKSTSIGLGLLVQKAIQHKEEGNDAKDLAAIFEQDREHMDQTVLFAHTNDQEAGMQLQSLLSHEGGQYCIGSVVGAHAGPGAVAHAGPGAVAVAYLLKS